MKNECEIVQDLLFSYYDGVISNSSKELVEEHLKNCENCKQALEEIRNDKIEENKAEEIDYLNKVHKKISKKTKIITIISIILFVVIAFNVFLFIGYYNKTGMIQILLKDDISEEQLGNLKQVLEEICDRDEISYYSKEDELNSVKEKFKDKENLLSTYEKDNPFRARIVIKVATNQVDKTIEKIGKLEGVFSTYNYTMENPYIWFISEFIK